MVGHACLYRGTVMHHRRRPVDHRFTYEVFSLYVDLGTLDELARLSPLLSVERWNLLSFHSRDHGARDGSPPLPWVLDRLQEAGIGIARPRVMLLCFPRVLGWVFNPLSVYLCHDDERPVAVVYEVKNTFGGQHAYVLPLDPTRRVNAHDQAKAFYVSPFLGMDTRYRFRLRRPDARLGLVIREHDRDGCLLVASHTGVRLPLDTRTLLACLARTSLMTLKVFGGIHLEALRLWLKGAPYHPEPVPPRARAAASME